MRIGYCKLGRSWNMDVSEASTVGGDLDVIRLLKRLALHRPDDKFVLLGKNSGHEPEKLNYPSNVINPWSLGLRLPIVSIKKIRETPEDIELSAQSFIEQLSEYKFDALVMWLGQHGAANSRLPQVDGSWEHGPFTNPQMAFVNYCNYILQFCNVNNVEPILLCPDPRNYMKARELRIRPTMPILGQFNMTRGFKHDLGPGVGNVVTLHHYEYAAVEMTALDDPKDIKFDSSIERWRGADTLVLVCNENRREVSNPRAPLVRGWVLDQFPAARVYGTWSEAGCAELGTEPKPVPASQLYDTLRSALCTVSFPASGSGWVTSKVWECFAVGTVCFLHPGYDTQRLSVSRETDRKLHDFLRISSRLELLEKAAQLKDNYTLWAEIVNMQRRLFEQRFNATLGGAGAVSGLIDTYTSRSRP